MKKKTHKATGQLLTGTLVFILLLSACGERGDDDREAAIVEKALTTLANNASAGESPRVNEALEILGKKLEPGLYVHRGSTIARHNVHASLGLVAQLEIDSRPDLLAFGFKLDTASNKQRVTCVGTRSSEIMRVPKSGLVGVLVVGRERYWITPVVPDLRSSRRPGVVCKPAENTFQIGVPTSHGDVHYRHLADTKNLPPLLLIQANAKDRQNAAELFYVETF